MRAIVIATGVSGDPNMSTEGCPNILLPMVDRPFLQHVVESLVEQGVREIDFVLHSAPEQIERLLGDGTRWGSSFRFHLARDPQRPYAALKHIVGNDQEEFLLCHADRLPESLPPEMFRHPATSQPRLLCWRDGTSGGGTDTLRSVGWSRWSAASLVSLSPELDEASLIGRRLDAGEDGAEIVETSRPLSVQDYHEYLSSQSRMLQHQIPAFQRTGREIEPGIWLSRNVGLHPTVRLNAPVFIGENCRIGPRTSLGPGVVVGHDSIIDADCTLSNAAVLPGSYLGKALDLHDVVVDHRRLVNVRLGAAVSITDDFILGSLTGGAAGRTLARWSNRVVGLLLLMLLSPLLLGTAVWLKLFRAGPMLRRTEISRPAGHGRRSFRLWSFVAPPACSPECTSLVGIRDLLLRFAPGLVNVATGDLRIVGVRPRTASEWSRLPGDWHTMCDQVPAGLVTEAYANYGPYAGQDDEYASEAYYVNASGPLHDLHLLRRYLQRILLDSWSAPTPPVPCVKPSSAASTRAMKAESTHRTRSAAAKQRPPLCPPHAPAAMSIRPGPITCGDKREACQHLDYAPVQNTRMTSRKQTP